MTFQSVVKNHVSIPSGHGRLPIEITVVGKFPADSAKDFINLAFKQQTMHATYIEEYNEASALIGKPTFSSSLPTHNDSDVDPTAIYTFGVDTRDLVFHRHTGHRVIFGIAGKKGCVLRFSLCTPEEATASPISFFQNLYVVNIPAGRLFSLRFNGMIYHQFGPADSGENAFFAVSLHANEASGLSGELLEKVLVSEVSIPLLTEPAPETVLTLLKERDAYEGATFIDLDCIE